MSSNAWTPICIHSSENMKQGRTGGKTFVVQPDVDEQLKFAPSRAANAVSVDL